MSNGLETLDTALESSNLEYKVKFKIFFFKC